MQKYLDELDQLIKGGTIRWTIKSLKEDINEETKSAVAYMGVTLGWSLTVVSFRLRSDPDTIRYDGAAAYMKTATVIHLTPELAKVAARQAEERTK